MTRLITSNRLTIHPRTLADIEDCMAMDRDPMVTRYIKGPWHDPVKHKAFLTQRMTTQHPHPFGYWSIALKENPNEFLGWVMLLPIDTSISKAEIGWRFKQTTWGKGIATEATQRVVEMAAACIPNLAITASIHPENLGSIKVAEKIGMTFDYEKLIDGTLEQFYSLRVSRLSQP